MKIVLKRAYLPSVLLGLVCFLAACEQQFDHVIVNETEQEITVECVVLVNPEDGLLPPKMTPAILSKNDFDAKREWRGLSPEELKTQDELKEKDIVRTGDGTEVILPLHKKVGDKLVYLSRAFTFQLPAKSVLKISNRGRFASYFSPEEIRLKGSHGSITFTGFQTQSQFRPYPSESILGARAYAIVYE